MRKLIVAATLCVTGTAFGAQSQQTFMPKNDLYKQDYMFWNNSEINEAKFNEIIDLVSGYYKPIIEAKGATLTVNRLWNDGTVNASAQQDGNEWVLNMYGGLARRPETTPDGFALVVCHELGHHLGGFAFYAGGDWASNEGNSDYFATLACARNIWKNQADQNAKAKATAHKTVIEKCDVQWTEQADRDLCYRSAMGGKALADLLGALGGERVDFDTPDSHEVTSTDDAHPAAQCRLDTYFAGALCTANFDQNIIPGRNNADGQESMNAEAEASKYSCMGASGFKAGLRPRCWYKPNLSITFDKAKTKLEEVTGNGDDAWEPGETYAINVPIANYLSFDITNAKVAMSSSNRGVSVGNAATYPTIAAGKTEFANEGVNVTLADSMACGSRFDLTADVTSDSLAHSDKFSYMVGKLASAFEKEGQPNLSIPDDSTRGATVTENVALDGTAGMAQVELDISHSYPSDLTITLIAPSGKSFPLFDRNGSGDGIKGVFAVDLGNESIKGDWRILFVDTASMDEGTVNSYKLTLSSAVCGTQHAVTLLK